jgi:hypothetical protein
MWNLWDPPLYPLPSYISHISYISHFSHISQPYPVDRQYWLTQPEINSCLLQHASYSLSSHAAMAEHGTSAG